MNLKVALVKQGVCFLLFWNRVMERPKDQCQYLARAMESRDLKYGRNICNVRTLNQAKSKVLEGNRLSHLTAKSI